MDKNRGIWLAIAGILIVGILVTFSTTKFVKTQEQTMASLALETSKAAAAQKERGAESKTSETTSSAEIQSGGGETVAAGLLTETQKTESADPYAADTQNPAMVLAESDGDSGGDGLAGAQTGVQTAAEETVQSPLKAPNKIQENLQAEAAGDLGVYYKKRLEELDSQIQKMKDSDVEQTTYSMTSSANKEWKLWDTELNTVYNEIMSTLSAEDAKQLVEEERQWIKMRDAAALESSQKYSGGSMEGLEYTLTLASYTRDRVYDLVNTYFYD